MGPIPSITEASAYSPQHRIAPEDLSRFGYASTLQYSAANDRGRDQLNASLCDAIDWLRHPDRQGSVVTGAGRARVRRQLEALRDSEASVPAEQRQYRTLERNAFLRICDAAGGVGSVEHLLSYLNNAGAVFYRKGLFHDRIVLDQAWALDAIYAVFQRDKCYRQLQEMHGRFTRPILANLVWQDYSLAEQRLFLSMMISCGICFPHRAGTGLDDDTAEYIAPDLLCEQDVVQAELESSWNINQAGEQETFTYTLLPPSLLRSLIARIGRAAGVKAIYWRNGVCVYETSMRTLAVITQEQVVNWGGAIRIHTQGSGAANLLNRLTEWVEEEHANAGLDPNDVARSSPKAINRDDDPIAAMLAQALLKQPPLVFGALPVLLRN